MKRATQPSESDTSLVERRDRRIVKAMSKIMQYAQKHARKPKKNANAAGQPKFLDCAVPRIG